MDIRKTLISLLTKSAPKQDEAGWSVFGSGINPSWGQSWWQQGLSDPAAAVGNTAVEACVGQYARTIGMLPVVHYKDMSNGGKQPVKNSIVTKVLRKPNAYQNRTDFMNNLIRAELFEGNGYAVALRDGDFKISELHLLPPKSTTHYVDPDTQDIYYHVGQQSLIKNSELLIPARDILHVRMQTSGSDPLKGETPMMSGLLAASAGTSIQKHNAALFKNMAKPVGTLNTELELSKEQIVALREKWNEQAAGINTGGTPILSHGLKYQPMTTNATDSEMIAFYKLTVADIARIYGIPQALIGIMESSTFSNVETLLNMWVATSLGFMVDHIELALEDLFDLPSDEHINFNLDYMLRGDLENRMAAYSKGIMSGVYSINEARSKEGLPAVEGGDNPRVQMQVVELTHNEEQLQLDKDRLELERDKVESSKSGDTTMPDEKAFIKMKITSAMQ